MNTHQSSTLNRLAVITALILVMGAGAGAQTQNPVPILGFEPYPEAAIENFRAVPVQDGGRIKPMGTFAGFTMLKLHGKRSMKIEVDGEEIKIRPMQWVLDTIFRPEMAKDFPTFRVDDSDIVTMFGGTGKEQKQDWYSYNELAPHRERLFEMAQRYSDIEEDNRTAQQNMILALAHNFHEFELLIHFMDWARHDFSVESGEVLQQALPDKDPLRLTDVIKSLPKIEEAIVQTRALADEGFSKAHTAETQAFEELYGALDFYSRTAVGINLIVPADPEREEWYAPGELVLAAFDQGSGGIADSEFNQLAALEALPQKLDNPEAFNSGSEELKETIAAAAETRGEYSTIPLENFFYAANPFFYALVFYVLSFLLVAAGWLAPQNRMLAKVTPVMVAIPTLLLISGITIRCIIQSRPPVTTLYETILFITATAVCVALFIETVNRQRIAVAVGSILGVIGMFLANRYELKDGTDTMTTLQAVLDTNFWLSTHVTTVTIGYAAGLLAAAIGHVYILGQLFKFKKSDSTLYRNLTRMTYGVVCFGLLFSVVGTVLGGIWANYSWGRFWGWDPKENGALMIVLWNLVILHSRMGGYIRDLGLAMFAVFGGMIVAFSWWGVNLLGVGLHSYGFISGVMSTLGIFWAIELAVILVGAFVWFRDSFRGASKPSHAT